MSENGTLDLAAEIWHEASMMELLGCTKKQLRKLALEGVIPGVRLQQGLYVFVARDVLDALRALKASQAKQTTVKSGLTTP